MRTNGRSTIAYLLTTLVLSACADEEVDVGSDPQEVIVGGFAEASVLTRRGGGMVAAGASMSGRADGVADTSAQITVTGIPAGATVTEATLYWAISGGSDTTARFNGTVVTATLDAQAGDTCWGIDTLVLNEVFAADVTALVTGNEVYTVRGLPSSVVADQPDTDGVALLVAYEDPTGQAVRTINRRHGAITAQGQDFVSDAFNIAPPAYGGPALLHLVVGDGQAFPDADVRFDEGLLGTDQWSGGEGALWDVETYSPTLFPGQTNGVWSSGGNADCLLYAAAALDYQISICGDGDVGALEDCDDGQKTPTDGDGCSSTCQTEPGWDCVEIDGTPSICTTTCGDGIIAGNEECDDSNTDDGDGCSEVCNVEFGYSCLGEPSVCTEICGDGFVIGDEECDDDDLQNGDGCSRKCKVEPGWTCFDNEGPSQCDEICGDGLIVGAEACDDGDTSPGDGCSDVCTVEFGWECVGAPSECTEICGDGFVVGAEECDDDGTAPGDGCSATCTVEPGWTCFENDGPSECDEICGDGLIVGAEECDDGGTGPGDGCSRTCTVEPGWGCTGQPSACDEICGDGLIVGAEQCDDGDTSPGDGCSATCTVETGWTCSGEASQCDEICGDGLIVGAEGCDDGDTTPGDGCSETCTVETGWTCSGQASECDEICGDGLVVGAEGCDDGGTATGDGCDATCEEEPGWDCLVGKAGPSECNEVCGDGIVVGDEECDDAPIEAGLPPVEDGCDQCQIDPGWECEGMPSQCDPICGDGVIVDDEACDDGNTDDDDGCDATCTVEDGWSCDEEQPTGCSEICGDGLIVGDEECDDENVDAGDGCDADCAVEDGWSCMDEPSVCELGCGDGELGDTEECDDGNNEDGDGCDASCDVEGGWVCTLEPSECNELAQCGDGLVADDEDCDDGNTHDGDGCGATCGFEEGFVCDGEPTVCVPFELAGGGCAAGGGGGMPIGALFLVAVALWLAARRRRAAALVAGALILALSGAASAQVGGTEYPAERFRLSSDEAGILDVESARTPGNMGLSLGLWLGYADDPITVRTADDQMRLGQVVDHRVGGELVGSIGILDNFEIGAAAPLILSQSQDLGDVMGSDSLSSLGLGDLRLIPKFAVLRGSLDLALAATVTLPSSTADDYFGDSTVTAAPAVLIGHRADPWRAGAELGYRFRDETHAIGLDIDDEMYANVGAGFRILPPVELLASLSFATAASDPFSSYNTNSAELRGGAGIDVLPAVRLFAAGGVGVAEGYGTADWRVLAGLWFGGKPEVKSHASLATPVASPEPTPEPAPQPEAPPPAAEPPVPADDDTDGIVNKDDPCPTEPGPVENKGCPDTDKDSDTVVDRLDACPDVAGPPAKNGCPDQAGVVVTATQIKVLEVIYFKTNSDVIRGRSHKILKAVAATLKAHADITKVIVEGYTDDRGDDAYNKDLSQRRAQSVVTFLVGEGVPATSLEPQGFGEEKPIAPNDKESGRSRNRRVEFRIAESK